MNNSAQHELIIKFLCETNRAIFLTGKAGTGKTTFLHHLKSILKNFVVVAPTAVAAINAGGLTIHSFFQVPFGPFVPKEFEEEIENKISLLKISIEKSKILKALELLIIDEISMVRADTLDYLDTFLRLVRGSTRPFGGVQLLMIGDPYQLPPVYQSEWPLLKKYYRSPYFFDSYAFQSFPPTTFELTQIYRQTDQGFIEILNNIRSGSIDDLMLKRLNERYEGDLLPDTINSYITLTTHNQKVNEINRKYLEELKGNSFDFRAIIEGDFSKESYPADEILVLKIGAQVMFLKNDSSGQKKYYNGRMARITEIEKNKIKVIFIDDESEFEVTYETWENLKYTFSDSGKRISNANAGFFKQYPIRLAWAITIHKSQGLTFERAVIDIDAAFSPGQTYVALSRCKSLKGIILKMPVRPENILTDPCITSFMQKATSLIPNDHLLEESKIDFEFEVLRDVLDFKPVMDYFEMLELIIEKSISTKNLLVPSVTNSAKVLMEEIKKIADKFSRQELAILSRTVSPGGRPEFVNRLKKASDYFVPKVIELIEVVDSTLVSRIQINPPFEFYGLLNPLMLSLRERLAALKEIGAGSCPEQILKVVRDTSILFKPISSQDILKYNINEKAVLNMELYQQLISWRRQISIITGVADYTILSEKVLKEIAAKVPKSLTQLAKIKGMGEIKAAEYGEQLLHIVQSFTGRKDLFF